jgi:hypothetical protein
METPVFKVGERVELPIFDGTAGTVKKINEYNVKLPSHYVFTGILLDVRLDDKSNISLDAGHFIKSVQ